MRLIIKNVRQWKVRNDLFRFGVLTMVVAIFWVGIELLQTYKATTIPEDYSSYVEPLTPTLDLKVMEDMEQRVSLPENFKVLVVSEEEEVSQEEEVSSSTLKTLGEETIEAVKVSTGSATN